MLASASPRFDADRSITPDVAAIAALLADPTRAAMLLALMPKGERFLECLSVE